MLLPWATRSERHAAIDKAVAAKQQAIKGRDQARVIEHQINQLVAQNNWAYAVGRSLGLINGDRNGDK